MLVKAMRVGAAALARSMLAEARVLSPYLVLRVSMAVVRRVRRLSDSSEEKRLRVWRWSGTRLPSHTPT